MYNFFLRNKVRVACVHQYRCYHSYREYFGNKPRVTLHNDVECAKTIEQHSKHRHRHASVVRLVDAFRSRGHLLSNLDPLNLAPQPKSYACLEIDLSDYENDSTVIDTRGIVNMGERYSAAKVSEIVQILRSVYCGRISVEYSHLSDPYEREWLANRWESVVSDENILTDDERVKLAKDLIRSETFDQFVATKFASVKRYGCEGAETMISFFDYLFNCCGRDHDITDIVIGMPHRGRLNLLTGLLNYPPVAMFQKMQGKPEFDLSLANGATGDVLSHLFTSVDLKYSETHRTVHVSLLPNPSHLEAVSPVVCGKARGKAMTKRVGQYAQNGAQQVSPILPVQVHGDGAFTGQGVIMETLSMANVAHYSVDGSIHLIVNNQIAYTTPGESCHGRSTRYCSDIMKAIDAPCIHVNGDYPEDVVKAARIAIDYRQKFGKDIAVDLICYRQWGHNELDDPTFTNPVMYGEIHARPLTVPKKYAQHVLTGDGVAETVNAYTNYLSKHFHDTDTYAPINTNLKGVWNGITYASNNAVTEWDTSVTAELLSYIIEKSAQEIPDTFNLHPTLRKILATDRVNRVREGVKIDWSTGEALAFGSLLYQGFNVRISGQDVGRGTFSQRHAMIVDQTNGNIHVPLNYLSGDQTAFLEVCNSILSEEAVLAMEYGASIDSPNNLVIWEAQFGDFFNGAQIMFDTFVSSGETKWLLQSSLTILLPHGYDGAGPEHSSCRIERFLQMCDSSESAIDSDHVNWCVANPTLPSQYFHLLRRQQIRNYRKPLIVATPKILLRHPQCVSAVNEFTGISRFKPVLSDPMVIKPENYSRVKRVVFCSGKHYYALSKERSDKQIANVAIIRLEELCPFPAKQISDELAKYKHVKDFLWSQEEHQNMGAWSFVSARFNNIFNCKLKYVGRKPLSAPAVAIGLIHKKEESDIVRKTFEF